MATFYYPEEDGGNTSNSNVNYRIKVDTSIVSSSARTVKLTASLQFKNTQGYTGTYYSQNIQWEYSLGIGNTEVGSSSTWSMSNITSWTTLISTSETVSAQADGSVSFSTWAESTGYPTPGRISGAEYTDTVASGLPQQTTTYNFILNPASGEFSCSFDPTWRSTRQTYVLASGSTVTNVLAKRTGYTCTDGWYTAASGGTKVLDNGGSLIGIARNWELYPHWTINSYSIKYYNDDTLFYEESKNYNSTVSIISSVPVKEGYTFLRWNTSSSGLGTNYQDGDTFILGAEEVHLYAIWKMNETIVERNKSKNVEIKNSNNWISHDILWIKYNGEWNLIKDIFIKKDGNWE